MKKINKEKTSKLDTNQTNYMNVRSVQTVVYIYHSFTDELDQLPLSIVQTPLIDSPDSVDGSINRYTYTKTHLEKSISRLHLGSQRRNSICHVEEDLVVSDCANKAGGVQLLQHNHPGIR